MAEHLVDVRVDQLSVECGIEVIFSILPFQCGGVGLNGLDSTRLDHIITNGPSLCVSKLFMRCAPTSKYHWWIKCEPFGNGE